MMMKIDVTTNIEGHRIYDKIAKEFAIKISNMIYGDITILATGMLGGEPSRLPQYPFCFTN